MNILFLTSKLNKTGGIQEYNKNLLNALDNLNHDVKIIQLEKSAIFQKIIFSIKTFLNALIKKPDLIFCTHVNFSPLCSFIKKIFKIKYFVFTHGIEVWNIKDKRKNQGLLNADIVTTVSRFSRKKLKQSVSELSEVKLLPNMIDGNRFKIKDTPKELIEKYNLENKKIIFTISRLSKGEEDKGYDKVIKAMPKVLEEIPEAVYILGGKGNDIERIRNLIDNLGLKNNVILPGFISNKMLTDYYNLADVFIMPSKKEGFGIVFLEALACGTPVIAGNQDGSVDPLQDGSVGTLINPDNIENIANSTISVLSGNVDKKLLDSEYLRSQTLKKFDFDRFKLKVNNLIHEII